MSFDPDLKVFQKVMKSYNSNDSDNSDDTDDSDDSYDSDDSDKTRLRTDDSDNSKSGEIEWLFGRFFLLRGVLS